MNTTTEVFFILNRHRKTAELLDRSAFPDFALVQGAFRCGFTMSDGHEANGIGRCKNRADFIARAARSNISILA